MQKNDWLELAGSFYDTILVINQSETFKDHVQHWQKEDGNKNHLKFVILGSLMPIHESDFTCIICWHYRPIMNTE